MLAMPTRSATLRTRTSAYRSVLEVPLHLINRRRFLRSSAAGLLAAPFLGSPLARANPETGGATRLLILFTPNGTVHEHWRPSGGEFDFSFPAGSILEPLAGLEEDLLILGGMDFNTGNNHEGGMAAMLTAGGLDSIDQVIARKIVGESRFPSLELGVQTSAWGGSVQTRMSYLDGGYVTPDDSPTSVWSRLFGDVGDEALLKRRLSVLDIASAELDTLHGRLGTGGRKRINQHQESLAAIERSISGGGCAGVSSPDSFSTYDNDAFPGIADAQLSLAVQALACDASRVVSVQLAHTVTPVSFTWLGINEGHHSLSHAGDTDLSGVEKYVACERWFAEQVANTITKLKETEDPETGAPMLDSTLVLWAKELGDGRLHTCTDVPWVLAGNAGGFFTTGRYLELGGATHDAVLTSICNAFGLSNTQFGVGTAGALEVLR